MAASRIKSASENPAAPADRLLYEKVVADAKDKFDVWPSVYASSWVVREYKRRGGRYINPLEGLDQWYAETWVDLGRSIDSKGRVKSWGSVWPPRGRSGLLPKMCTPGQSEGNDTCTTPVGRSQEEARRAIGAQTERSPTNPRSNRQSGDGGRQGWRKNNEKKEGES